MTPRLLFKFRPVITVEQLSRLIDSINKNHIYLPDYKKFNDPLESSGYIIELPGYAGKSFAVNADEEDRYVKAEREKYKILALTEYCFSPCMWAHYTNEYRGVCIGYWNRDAFKDVKKVSYIDKAVDAESKDSLGLIDVSKLGEEVEKSFFYKHSDWSYEKEWRIVKNGTDSFLNYQKDDLACIIFGRKLDKAIRDIIISSIIYQPKMFYTHIGHRSFGINLLPLGYEIQGDGSHPPFIRNIEELINSIHGKQA